MQVDQFLRRAVWRIRRWLRPSADNDPIVNVAPPAIEPARAPRRGKLRRTAIAFAVTFSMLAVGYAFLVAASSQTPLDAAEVIEVEAGGSRAIAAAAAFLVARAEDISPGVEETALLPNGRRLRSERIAAGTREAAVAFVTVAAEARTGGQTLREASEALAAGDHEGARDALVRANLRLAGGRVDIGSRAGVVSAVANAAAAACEAEEIALREAALSNSGGMVGPKAQAQFSHGRGVAYGWLMILRAALADAPEVAEATVVEAAIPLDALAAAAERQPLFLFNGGDRAPWAPAHLEDQAAEFARAAAGARALSAAAAKTRDTAR